MKSVENMYYTRGLALEQLLRAKKTSAEISAFEYRHERAVRDLKDKSIETLKELHPPFFQRMMEFENWDEANKYLTEYQEVILRFWEE